MTTVTRMPRRPRRPSPVSSTGPTGRAKSATGVLLVDPAAVTRNVRTLRSVTAGEVMAVVKGDAFGHGLATVARAAIAGGATRFGVTSLHEARALRDAGFTEPVLSWLNPVDADFTEALRHDVEVAVPTVEHLQAVAALAPGARIHLQLDTGLARDGSSVADWPSLCREARDAERAGRVRVVGLMGHLPCADRRGDPSSAAGRTRFEWGLQTARAFGLRPVDRHLAATAATLTDPRSHHTMSRVGAGLVGIDEAGTGRLEGASTLSAPLVQVREVRAGTAVGYGHTWRAAQATVLGLLPLGYADGLPRVASGRAEVLVGDQRRPVVGRISMDMAVIDLGPAGAARLAVPGEVVTVFGPGHDGEPTPAEWARWSDTVPHEIVSGLGSRVHRATHPTGVPARHPRRKHA